MGCLAEGMFCIGADVEGVQFSREGKRERLPEQCKCSSQNIDTTSTQKKRHINNILYKLLQQHMLVCSTVKFISKAHNHNLR